MAQSGTKLCRFFTRGLCNRSDCQYLHDRNAPVDNTCEYFLAGSCMYGDRCWYDHVRPKGSSVVRHVPEKFVPLGGASKSPWQLDSGSKEEEESQEPDEEFPPLSYAQAAKPRTSRASATPDEPMGRVRSTELCQYARCGVCPMGDDCEYTHGDLCETCGCQVLHPYDEEQRLAHESECNAALEKEMKLAFAVQRSSEKACSICMELVLENTDRSKQRFGILENCGHTFCFECIMNWRRQSKETIDRGAIRSCPECRVHSNYVIPSRLWPDSQEERQSVIADYKSAMGKRPCRNFAQGEGKCAFGGKCWFLHTSKDGTRVDLPDPRPKRIVEGGNSGARFLHPFQLSDFLDGVDDNDNIHEFLGYDDSYDALSGDDTEDDEDGNDELP
ncbi:hypothetical protein RvY_05177 [Ramazzottius varieornatus]|uniref:RING-type E3 ubiquitin transferase n=1 Tax=Ramazzottius varieornatus TaxID=947166 RepID=A0A1D1UU75_RAMVA|nr:hypothetical protein RvY_05177 [Ramazzottius varieornatus]